MMTRIRCCNCLGCWLSTSVHGCQLVDCKTSVIRDCCACSAPNTRTSAIRFTFVYTSTHVCRLIAEAWPRIFGLPLRIIDGMEWTCRIALPLWLSLAFFVFLVLSLFFVRFGSLRCNIILAIDISGIKKLGFCFFVGRSLIFFKDFKDFLRL